MPPYVPLVGVPWVYMPGVYPSGVHPKVNSLGVLTLLSVTSRETGIRRRREASLPPENKPL